MSNVQIDEGWEESLKKLRPAEAAIDWKSLAYEAGVQAGRTQQKRTDLRWAAASILVAATSIGIVYNMPVANQVESKPMIAEVAVPSKPTDRIDNETIKPPVLLPDEHYSIPNPFFPFGKATVGIRRFELDDFNESELAWLASEEKWADDSPADEVKSLRAYDIRKYLHEIF